MPSLRCPGSLPQTNPCVLLLSATLFACSASSTSSSETETTLEIVTTQGTTLAASAGDAVTLNVVMKMSNGSTQPLPAGAHVTWMKPGTVTALDPASTAASPLPTPGDQPTAFFIDNPGRPDRSDDLAGVLFLLDPGKTAGGKVAVQASVTGVPTEGLVNASIPIGPLPVGDSTRGATVFGAAGANCALCHGATGHGTSEMAEGGTDTNRKYVIVGKDYPYPVPGLNAEPGNCGSDPAWNAALFAIAARADMDNGGLTLRVPMPDWLVTPATNGTPPTTQDLFDAYAFMQTQTR